MNTEIIVALLTGAVSILTTVITVVSANSRTRSEIRTQLAVQEQKVTTLTEEVRRHNDFATRLPVLEEKVESLEGRVDRLEGR